MNNADHFKDLLEKFRNNTISIEEKALLENWILFGEFSEPEFPMADLSDAEINRQLDRLGAKLPLATTSKKLWPRFVVVATLAASLFLIASLGFYFYNIKQSTKSQNTVVFTHDIAPGKEGATLTLADGEKILIKDALAGNIASQSGVKISKTADGQIVYEITEHTAGEGANAGTVSGAIAYNTLSTSRGERTQVRLPDGTVVFLNAASSLKYPTNFVKMENRQVSLIGEGYFDVAKDKKHPFIVKSRDQQIEVLGTHFNISAYADDKTTTTSLLEGSVKVSPQNIGNATSQTNGNMSFKTLVPGEQSVLSTTGIQLKPLDTEQALAWKNGDFIFNDAAAEDVMKQLARWYNIEVVYVGEHPKDQFTGEISRSKSLSKVLELLQQTKGVHFKIEERRVIVSQY